MSNENEVAAVWSEQAKAWVPADRDAVDRQIDAAVRAEAVREERLRAARARGRARVLVAVAAPIMGGMLAGEGYIAPVCMGKRAEEAIAWAVQLEHAAEQQAKEEEAAR